MVKGPEKTMVPLMVYPGTAVYSNKQDQIAPSFSIIITWPELKSNHKNKKRN